MKVNVYIYTKRNIAVLEISAQILGDQDVPRLESVVKDLITKSFKNFILDLAEVRLINSIGIGTIMACMTSIAKAKGELKLSTVPEKVTDTLSLMGILPLFEIYDNLEEAVASYQSDS